MRSGRRGRNGGLANEKLVRRRSTAFIRAHLQGLQYRRTKASGGRPSENPLRRALSLAVLPPQLNKNHRNLCHRFHLFVHGDARKRLFGFVTSHLWLQKLEKRYSLTSVKFTKSSLYLLGLDQMFRGSSRG